MFFVLIKAVLWIVVIIGLVIFIHEFGHFITAKLVGIKVEEFAFGYGKKIFGKKIGDTLYRINVIPYGGYVKLLGEEKETDDPRSYSGKPIKSKVLVISAGVIMNFILAIFIFSLVVALRDYNIFLPRVSDYRFLGAQADVQNKPIVETIIEDTPAAEVDFPTDVVVWSIDGEEICNVDDLLLYLSEHKGEEINIKVLTFIGGWQEVRVTPDDTQREGVLLGVEFYNVIASYYKLDYSNNKALSGLFHTLNFGGYTLEIFKDLIVISFQEKSVKPVSEGVTGIVGVANRVVELVRVGDVVEIFNLAAGINLSLAIINLLPVPGLDGGHLLFLFIEKIRGRKLAEKYQEIATKIGLAFLILLGILVTVKDIMQFDIISKIVALFKNLF